MADPARNVQFNLNNDQAGQGNNDQSGQINNDQAGQINNDQARQVVKQNVPAGAQTTLAFKVKQ